MTGEDGGARYRTLQRSQLGNSKAHMSPDSSDIILREIAQVISTASGEEFFRGLAAALCRMLEVDFAFIGRLGAEDPHRIHVMAVCVRGKIVENFSYHLHGSPCENVVGREPCHYPRDVQSLFPEDRMLVEMGIESYIGHPLFGSVQQPLGLLAVMHSRSMPSEEPAKSMLKIFSARAAAELDRMQTEAGERKLSSIVEQTADTVVVTDQDGIIQYVNPAYEAITGYTRAEAVGKKSSIVKSGKHDKPFYERLWSTISRGEVFQERLINRRKDGSLYHEEKTITPLKDGAGRITHFVSTGKDITERMKLEQESRRMQVFLNSIIENLPNMLFVKNAQELRFVRFNKAAEELLGYSRDEMLGKNDHDFFPKEEADFFAAKDRDVLSKNVLHDIPEETIHTKHKGVRLLHTKKIPILDETGNPLYLLGISEDITERKWAEKTLRENNEILERIFDSTHFCLVYLDRRQFVPLTTLIKQTTEV